MDQSPKFRYDTVRCFSLGLSGAASDPAPAAPPAALSRFQSLTLKFSEQASTSQQPHGTDSGGGKPAPDIILVSMGIGVISAPQAAVLEARLVGSCQFPTL